MTYTPCGISYSQSLWMPCPHVLSVDIRVFHSSESCFCCCHYRFRYNPILNATLWWSAARSCRAGAGSCSTAGEASAEWRSAAQLWNSWCMTRPPGLLLPSFSMSWKYFYMYNISGCMQLAWVGQGQVVLGANVWLTVSCLTFSLITQASTRSWSKDLNRGLCCLHRS